MLKYPKIKPYIFKIGSREVRWYGLMYLVGFISSYLLVKRTVRRKGLSITAENLESLYFSIILGLVIGARLGYVLFYNFSFYMHNPLDIIAVWHGGMSFHGGLIGTVIAGLIFARKHHTRFLLISDLVMPTAPIGLFCGRIGNFINGELYGRPTDVPWAMIFPEGGDIPRHPSQLYEALLEGVVLFAVLWVMKDRTKREGTITAMFIFLYGAMRFFVEFFREPDPQLGFIFNRISMGQILSSIMIIAGLAVLAIAKSRNIPAFKNLK